MIEEGWEDIPALDSKPTLYSDLYEDWMIFWKLCGRRGVDGMSGRVGPIPYAEIEAYFRIFKIEDLEQRERLLERIDFLDRIYCDHFNTKGK